MHFYDNIGRLIKTSQNTTFGNCQTNFTVYDAAGKVVASICNYDPGAGADPTTVAQAVALFNPALPDKNRVTTYTYDTLGRLVAKTVDAGAAYALTTVTAPDTLGRIIRTIVNYIADGAIPNPYVHARGDFSHGTNNDQNLITDSLYNERGQLRKQIDVRGNVSLYGYDDTGRQVYSVQNASHPDYDNSYGTSGDSDLSGYADIAVSDPDLDLNITQVFDTANNVIRTTDVLGNVTLTAYDALNRPVKAIHNASQPGYDMTSDPALASYTPSSAADQDLIEITEYDKLGRVRRVQDVLGRSTLYGYDALGRKVKTIQNASLPSYTTTDTALQSYVASNQSDQDLVTQVSYDPAGRPMFTRDVLGRQDWTAYDGLWRAVRQVDNAIGSATDNGTQDPRSSSYVANSALSDQDQIALTEYDSDRRVRRTRDNFGNWTLYGYDSVNRPIKVIKNASNFDYNAASDPTLASYTPAGGAEADQDLVTETSYNGQGRVATTTNELGIETRYTYDALGRVLTTITNYVTGTFNASYPDQDLTMTNSYDLAGQVIATVDVRGTQTTIDYDNAGRKQTVTMAAGTPLVTTDYTCYDKSGRVLRTIRNWIATATSPDARDGSGNWLFAPSSHGTNNDENLIITNTIDKAGRVTAISDPLGNTSSLTYDKAGEMLSSTDPLNVVTVYRYDDAGRRVLSVQNYVSNGEDPALWRWNGSAWTKSNGTTVIALGSAFDQNLIVRVEYDKAGRKSTQRDPRGNRSVYRYDKLDRRIRMTDPLPRTWQTFYRQDGSGKQTITQVKPDPQLASTVNGLQGYYFSDRNLTVLAMMRIDTTINFAWGTGSPDPSIGNDLFSIRWVGQVQPTTTETYTFYTYSDDGVRLWVDGQLLINHWAEQGPTEYSATIDLVAGQHYDIRLEYFELGGGANVRLQW